MALTYEPIQTTTLGSANATVTFSAIPSTYTDLVVIFNGAATAGNPSVWGRFNGDTAGNYSFCRLLGNGSTATSSRGSNTSYCGLGTGTGVTTTYETNNIWHIFNYANTTTFKTSISRNNVSTNGTETNVSTWRSTAAITSVSVVADTSTFIAGSTFTLYGIKAA